MLCGLGFRRRQRLQHRNEIESGKKHDVKSHGVAKFGGALLVTPCGAQAAQARLGAARKLPSSGWD
jgi:hypothetical protein